MPEANTILSSNYLIKIMAKEFSSTSFGRKKPQNMPNCSKSQFLKSSEENSVRSKPGFIPANIMWQLGREGSLGENGYMYMYG